MKNPNWHREEVILALDLYFDKNIGAINVNNPKIIQLSELLNKLPIHVHRPDEKTFRNPNGIVMKLGNFKALDPNYAGVGLKAHSRLEKEVFEEFYSDQERLHIIAAEIKKDLKDM